MNVRKPIDYSAMFAALALMAEDLPQTELYCEIGRLVSGRPEKGAAVAAAEYLRAAYPGASGFSPRNLRRMREFYHTYENTPAVLAEAMALGWTQNVVILEADLALREREWYIHAVKQFRWSKLELRQKIDAAVHIDSSLDISNPACYTEENSATVELQRTHQEDDLPPRLLPGRVRFRQILAGLGRTVRRGVPPIPGIPLHLHPPPDDPGGEGAGG